MLDVGQGLAVVVRTQAHVLVYDAGPAFRRAATPVNSRCCRTCATGACARSTRSSSATAISITPAERTACCGGLPSLRVLAGPSVGPLPSRARRVDADNAGSGTACSSRCLHPARSARASDNDSSCVLRVHSTAGSVLLAGRRRRCRVGNPRQWPALHDSRRRAYHGSLTSSTRGSCSGTSCARAGVGRISQSLGFAAP